MATAHTIYLCNDDIYDLSRWLELRLEPTGDVSLTIADGQYPPGVRFRTPIRHLQVVADGLAYHVSEHGNYCAFHVEDFKDAVRHLYPGVAYPPGPSLF